MKTTTTPPPWEVTPIKELRTRLMKESNNKCHWCGCELVYYERPDRSAMPHNFATVNHVFTKLSTIMGKRARGLFVIACAQCSDRRAKEAEQALPIEELHRRSNSRPLSSMTPEEQEVVLAKGRASAEARAIRMRAKRERRSKNASAHV